MNRSLLRAGFTTGALLFYCHFVAAQVVVPQSGFSWMLEAPVSTQEAALSNGVQGDDFDQMGVPVDEYVAANGPSVAHPVEATEFTVYPGPDTTVNGVPVYVSALIKPGDRVQTGRATGKLTAGNIILDLGLETTVVIQEPIVLNCGVIAVRSGTIAINNGKSTLSFAAGQTAYGTSPSCESALSDSPGTVQTGGDRELSPPFKSEHGATAAAKSSLFDARDAGWSFWAANAAMFGSSVAAAEMTHRCLEAGACRFVPNTFHRRRNMYLVGMPVAAGVSYFSYYLKRNGHRWWFVPPALVTVGNVVVFAHAARYH